MAEIVCISGKIMSIHEAAEKMNNISLAHGDFPDALRVFNLKFPSEAAITNGDARKGIIRDFSQEITGSEAI